MKRIANIFHSYKHFENLGKFNEEIFKHEYATQISMFDDFAKEKIFGLGKEGIAKVFMEGGGLPWEEKFKTSVKVLVGTFSFMSFNELPPCLEPHAPPNETKSQKSLRMPFVKICSYHETKIEYNSTTDNFPYESPDLAIWFKGRLIERFQKVSLSEKVALGKRMAEDDLVNIDLDEI